MPIELVLYKIDNLYMELMNKIDKIVEQMTEVQHSFMSTEIVT